jgi:CheY-like chemotaxis protein
MHPTEKIGSTKEEPFRILIAEDDPEMRSLMSAAMHQRGYEVIAVHDGEQLFSHLRRMAIHLRRPRPDLIVSDIRMPGYSGLELLEAMRGADLDLPVILITAFSDPATQDEARRLNAILLDKPLRMDALLQVVDTLLN